MNAKHFQICRFRPTDCLANVLLFRNLARQARQGLLKDLPTIKFCLSGRTEASWFDCHLELPRYQQACSSSPVPKHGKCKQPKIGWFMSILVSKHKFVYEPADCRCSTDRRKRFQYGENVLIRHAVLVLLVATLLIVVLFAGFRIDAPMQHKM